LPTRADIKFSTIDEALEDIAAGKMVVVVDDEDRENEGDLVMAAQFITPDAINFMATHARGWICLALTSSSRQSRRRSRTSPPARWSSSSTTRTARTRATS